MVRKFSASILATVATFLGALILSSGATASAGCINDNGVYNNNAGYTTCAPVNVYPDQSRGYDYRDGNWNDNIWLPVPYSNQQVLVPRYMWNYVWTEVRDEAGGYPRLDLRNWGPNPPHGIPCVRERVANYDYSSYEGGAFMVEGNIYGWGVHLR